MRHVPLVLASLVAPLVATAQVSDEASLLDRVAADPGDAAARLQLGEIYFARNQDRTAGFQLRQALAGGLDAPGQARALELLRALEARRTWIVTLDAAIAPSISREFLVVGEDGTEAITTRDSDPGLVAQASIENRTRLGEDVRLSSQVFVDASVFSDSAFNRVRAVALTGPLWIGEGDDTNRVRALYERQWDGDRREFDAFGVEAAAQRRLSDRVVGFGRLTVRDVDADLVPGRSGMTYGLDGSLSRNGLRGRFETVFAQVFRAETDADAERFWFFSAGVGAYREVGGGLGLYAEPSLALQDFDSGRQDVRLSVRLRAVKQDWRVFGSAPFASVTVSTIDSNRDGFDRDSTSVQLGLTRTF